MEIICSLPRETAWKVRIKAAKNNLKKEIDGSLNLILFCCVNQCYEMPGQHSPDKEPLSIQIPRSLLRRLHLKAAQLGMTLPSYVIAMLTAQTQDITLSSSDYDAIKEATKQAEQTGRRLATEFNDPAGVKRVSKKRR